MERKFEGIETLDISGVEETFALKRGRAPRVSIYDYGHGTNLYVGAGAAHLIRTDYVRIGKAGRYLLFHEANLGFRVRRRPDTKGLIIFIDCVKKQFGIPPEQIDGQRPLKIQDGFAVKLY